MPATPEQLAHLLRRTGVRATKARMAELASLEIAQAVDAVCDFSINPPLVIPSLADFVAAGKNEYDWGPVVRSEWFDRLSTLPNPLEAKLVLFWHGHFANSFAKVNSFKPMVAQYKLFHDLGTGPLEPFAQAVAIDPAMVLYLDNNANVKGAPNENFARELMELFLLGHNRGYTQDDVREAARAWTGYGVRWTMEGFFYEYHDYLHDTGNKTIFGITKQWTGPEMIAEICSGSRRRTCAEFLAAKLWAFFAYENPDPSLVSSLADDYESVGLHTLNFLRKMFARPEFYSVQSMQGRVKSPMEWAAMVLGAMDMKAQDNDILYYVSQAGHEFFAPPNVAGWKNNKIWMSETVTWKLDFVANYAARTAAYDTTKPSGSRDALVATTKMTPPNAVSAVADLFGLTLSASTRQVLETWVADARTQNVWNEASTLARLMAMTTEARLA
jgi:uncharacterized protein (DUF1800 family)